MSPDEVKQYADIVIAVMSAGGVTSILLAMIGAKKKAREDKDEDEKPNIGMAGMSALGGLIASESHLSRLIQAIEALTLAHTMASERHRSEADADRATTRRMVEELEGLNSGLKRLVNRLPERG